MTGTGKPITTRRLARMHGTLARRQPDLAIVLENLSDPHNVSACLRSCDAVGVATAHLVYTVEELPQLSSGVAASANRWLDLHRHESIAACYAALRDSGLAIYATALREESDDLFELDLTRPCVLVFGNESRGVSEEAIAGADRTVFIPMMGMVESLNVSVACAVALYETMRQRRAAGMYATPRWSDRVMETRLRDWLEREGRDPDQAQTPVGDDLPRARNRYEPRR